MEASLQEQLLEQFHSLVLSRAVAAGSTGRSQSALAAAAEAAELLRPILAVLPAAGAAGSACLGRACAALHSKKRLKGQATATGLQTIIQQLTAEGEEQGVTNQYCHVAPDMAPDLNKGSALSCSPLCSKRMSSATALCHMYHGTSMPLGSFPLMQEDMQTPMSMTGCLKVRYWHLSPTKALPALQRGAVPARTFVVHGC